MFSDILDIFEKMMKEEEIEEQKIDIETCFLSAGSEEDPLARYLTNIMNTQNTPLDTAQATRLKIKTCCKFFYF